MAQEFATIHCMLFSDVVFQCFSVLLEEDHNPSMRFDSSSKPTSSSTSQCSLVAASSLENCAVFLEIQPTFQRGTNLKHHKTTVQVTRIYWLVVWNIFVVFPYIGNFIIPTDEVILFRGVGSTTNQYSYRHQRLMVPTVDNV